MTNSDRLLALGGRWHEFIAKEITTLYHMDPANKWVGLVEVVQKPGISILGLNRGAHVIVIAWCAGEGEYAKTLNQAMDDADLVVLSLEDVETWG